MKKALVVLACWLPAEALVWFFYFEVWRKLDPAGLPGPHDDQFWLAIVVHGLLPLLMIVPLVRRFSAASSPESH
ncbi:hypothetical protein [Corynebacterium lowii]|uniref:Uncharacterized protein n=1 Tax=Corynebacterium lowii TaxID=1544413 RepID=A0A0Q1E413_9CORY|nr:hypothetical protein [Corynebacterium lowii]KQB87503.1 hypothetical protein Clow_00562 [Corynebacterium lowii]MDP9851902.1 hypothetical protein [Corynebacterium lowii]